MINLVILVIFSQYDYIYSEYCMITINLNEAKTHFSSIISSVEHNHEKVIILKHGIAVAEIIPLSKGCRTDTYKEIKNIKILYDPLESTESEWENV